jgi:hypothetical protein
MEFSSKVEKISVKDFSGEKESLSQIDLGEPEEASETSFMGLYDESGEEG